MKPSLSKDDTLGILLRLANDIITKKQHKKAVVSIQNMLELKSPFW